MITVFRTGEFDYSDSGIDKPVRYNVDNLVEVASRTSTIDVTDEHKKDVLSTMSNFIVKDGMLMADEPNNLELKGMGFSPVFNFDLIDCGDHYEPSNIKMTEIGYTKTPRTHIVYNEVYNDASPNGEVKNNMDDSEIQKLVKRNNELQEEIGVLKNTNKQLNKAIKDKDKEIKTIKESYSDVDAKVNEYDHLKEIETNYNKLISSKRDDLIHDIVGDDKEKAKKLESFTLEQLEFQKELMTGDSTPTGLTPNQVNDDGVPLDDGNIPSPTDDGDSMSKDEVIAFYEEEFGEKPSFIQD
jgi:archaellum component FlaC